MAKHTPGPWLHVGNTVYALTRDRRGNEVNRFYANVQASHQAHEATAEELGANAKLIAAAPDLLATLEELVRLLDSDGRGPAAAGIHTLARAAIAKATAP